MEIAWQVVLAIVTGGAAVIWWFIRKSLDAIDEEALARARDKSDLRGEIQAQAAKLQAFELKIASEGVNTERLHAALQPLESGMDRIEKTMERLFTELKGKADR